jgi:hypothetical protein
MFGIRIATKPRIEFAQMACERRVVAKKGAWPMLLDKLSGGLTSVEIVNKDRAWFPCSQKPQCEF